MFKSTGASAAPVAPPPNSISVPVEGSVWDRITDWATENKTIVYTIAGVTVVVSGAGLVYYLKKDSVRFRPRISCAVATVPRRALALRVSRVAGNGTRLHWTHPT